MAIGIFDSGMGGITVLNEISKNIKMKIYIFLLIVKITPWRKNKRWNITIL